MPSLSRNPIPIPLLTKSASLSSGRMSSHSPGTSEMLSSCRVYKPSTSPMAVMKERLRKRMEEMMTEIIFYGCASFVWAACLTGGPKGLNQIVAVVFVIGCHFPPLALSAFT